MARILIIEDDASVCQLYQAILGKQHQLQVASDGQSGFRLASLNDFDLIIADLHMPKWDGAVALATLNLVQPNLRFIIVSAYLQEERFHDSVCKIPNVIARIAKPFHTDTLLKVIDEALDTVT